jgi:molybdopterin/thiamine biosynthesis adenylyltransferase/transcription elongation factor Elf1
MSGSNVVKKQKEVVVVGCGGNIGSHFSGHMARMGVLDGVTFIDRDVYEPKNIRSQDITQKDIGKSKAMVQAERAKRINPEMCIEAIVDDVENIPLGKLRGDVIVGGLDNNGARLYLNEASWQLGGIPYIDAAVRPEGLLARVNVYVPGDDSACLECGWDQRDYEHLARIYPCDGEKLSSAPTNGPSHLGALVASLAAIECEKILTGQWDKAIIGKQILIDALHHKHYLTTLRRNPECRFSHRIWTVERLNARPGDVTLAHALRLGGNRHQGVKYPVLRLAGVSRFVRKLTCHSCGSVKKLLRLEHRLTLRQINCRRCGATMAASGFDMVDRIEANKVSPSYLKRKARSLGFRSQDIFSVTTPSETRYYEFGHE